MPTILRKDRRAVTPIVAEILLVAIAVVLAAMIYFMASALLQSPGANTPYVTFASPTRIPSGITGRENYSIQVADASRSAPFDAYKFNLMVENKTAPTAVAVEASSQPAPIVVNGIPYRVVWNDAGGGGMLNAGDTFTVSGNGAPLPVSMHFAFYLIWAADGSAIQTAQFQT